MSIYRCLLFKIGLSSYEFPCNIVLMTCSVLFLWVVLKCPVSTFISTDDKDNNLCPNLFTIKDDKDKDKDENARTKFIIGGVVFAVVSFLIFMYKDKIMIMLSELHPMNIASKISIIAILSIFFSVVVGLNLPSKT